MASRYWVAGGDGNWSSITNWSATSGGASGASVPGSSDAAFFDANSGAGTATVDSSVTIQTLTMTGFTGTLAFGTNTISLNSTGTIFTGATTYTVTGTPVINCTNSTSTARTISPTAPTESNAISFNITAGTGTVTFSSNCAVKTLDFTGFTGTLNANARTIYGDFKLVPGMTLGAGTNYTTFAATSGTQKLTSAGLTIEFNLGFSAVGATVELQDNVTLGVTRTALHSSGTLDLKNNTLSCGFFLGNYSATRAIAFGTGNITLTGNSGTVLSMQTATGFTYTGTPTINATYSGATGTRTIQFGSTAGGIETNAVSVNVSAGTDIVTLQGRFKNVNFAGFAGSLNNSARFIYGNLTVATGMTLTAGTSTTSFLATSGTQTVTSNGKTMDFPVTVNAPSATVSFADAFTQGSTRAFTFTAGTVQFKNGVTSTTGDFVTSGTAIKYLQSTTAGSQATLSEASGTVNASYLTIQDINATGGATWNAYVDQFNVDAGNNDGWDFGVSPVVGGAEYTYQLRSFTEPRRF